MAPLLQTSRRVSLLPSIPSDLGKANPVRPCPALPISCLTAPDPPDPPDPPDVCRSRPSPDLVLVTHHSASSPSMPPFGSSPLSHASNFAFSLYVSVVCCTTDKAPVSTIISLLSVSSDLKKLAVLFLAGVRTSGQFVPDLDSTLNLVLHCTLLGLTQRFSSSVPLFAVTFHPPEIQRFVSYLFVSAEFHLAGQGSLPGVGFLSLSLILIVPPPPSGDGSTSASARLRSITAIISLFRFSYRIRLSSPPVSIP